MQIMMMRSTRILLQEATHHDPRPDPCLHSSLHGLGTTMVQNASTVACQHAYAYVRRHHEGSPIPYLLAGLAAMLALIAISLFILACSYWKLVGCVEQHGAAARAANYTNTTPTNAPPPHNSSNDVLLGTPQELIDTSTKFVVIMAGHDKPSFIAQPVGLVLESVPASTAMKV